MEVIPLLVSAVVAALIAPAGLAALSRAGWSRPNYRDVTLPFPGGVLAVVATILSLGPLVIIDDLGGTDTLAAFGFVAPLGLGVALLGLLDDLLEGPARGWRGHAAAVVRGELSTGALKAIGTLSLALYFTGLAEAADVLSVAVVVLAANAFNLLDLRPGRAVKAFVLLGAVLLVAGGGLLVLEGLGPFIGPLLVLGAYDLRERAMLGDTGSNLLGALAGAWIVVEAGVAGEAVAAALLLAVNLFGELRSISAAIERVPPLRALDSLGRPRHA